MYVLTIILAVLSAGAFADNTHTVYLTAFAPTDTNCTGTPVGNNVTVTTPFLSPWNPKATPVKGDCMVYAPGSGQNIQFDFSNDSFALTAYSEPNCRNKTAEFTSHGSDIFSYCVPMNRKYFIGDTNDGADWQSIQLGPVYNAAYMQTT